MRFLMASVTCGTDCMVPPRNSPFRSLAITSENISPAVTFEERVRPMSMNLS